MAARRRPDGFKVVATGLILLAFGALVACLGSWHLHNLSKTYEVSDVAKPNDAVAFAGWLYLLSHRAKPQDARAFELVSRRLTSMTMINRRDLVLRTSSTRFWERMQIAPQRKRTMQLMLMSGAEQALRNAPAEGALWFLAGVLRTRLGGFDQVAQKYLKASYIFSPKEGDLVIERTNLAVLVWPTMSDELKSFAMLDLSVLKREFPYQYDKRKARLQQSGIPVK